ncbi:hypothetical protein [Streptomyces sp. NPDC057250]|uniref:hypothetical protein n=1 Tax=Streptomyces sp. NPDC057250 TaxID=3346068 RepID=UPI003645C29D
MTSEFILALMVVLGLAVPVVATVARVVDPQDEPTEDTPHEGLDCRDCDALASPPPGMAFRMPRQRQGGQW